jgi:hypothetical protein
LSTPKGPRVLIFLQNGHLKESISQCAFGFTTSPLDRSYERIVNLNLTLVLIIAIVLEVKDYNNIGDEIYYNDGGFAVPTNIYLTGVLSWVHMTLVAVLSISPV